MSSKERKEFLQWYDQKKAEGYVFDMRKELLEYCQCDVDILRRSCLQFRESFIKIANIDPFQYVTIASVCMAIFRGKFLEPGTIAVINNMERSENASKASIAWLDYMAQRSGIKIQHALEGREKRLFLCSKNRKVDGFDEANNTVYEFQGCVWHGCPKCYSPDTINKHNQIPIKSCMNRHRLKTKLLETQGTT